MPENAITLSVEPASRKRRPPSTAYSKERPSPHAFKAGQPSANPGGKPRHHRLLSRTARADVARRAPNEVARALGLPCGSSWGQCLIRSLLRAGVRGDLTAARLLFEYTEGAPPQRGAVAADGEYDESGEGRPPLIQVNFVSPEFTAEQSGTGPRILPPSTHR